MPHLFRLRSFNSLSLKGRETLFCLITGRLKDKDYHDVPYIQVRRKAAVLWELKGCVCASRGNGLNGAHLRTNLNLNNRGLWNYLRVRLFLTTLSFSVLYTLVALFSLCLRSVHVFISVVSGYILVLRHVDRRRDTTRFARFRRSWRSFEGKDLS